MGGVNEFCQQLITAPEMSDIDYNDSLNQEIMSRTNTDNENTLNTDNENILNTDNENTLNTDNENTLIVPDIDEGTIDMLSDAILAIGRPSSNSFAVFDSIRWTPFPNGQSGISILLNHPDTRMNNN